MRYSIEESPDASIALPPELAEALGRPEEAEVTLVGGGLLVRSTSVGMRMGRAAGRVAAIDEYRARLAPDLGFSKEEIETLRPVGAGIVGGAVEGCAVRRGRLRPLRCVSQIRG